jgi:DNA polymerase-1
MLAPLNVEAVYECDRAMMDIAIDWFKRGILIDMDAVRALALDYHNAEGTGILDKLEASVGATALEAGIEDFNPNSPKQLQDLLFTRLHLPPVAVTSSGQLGTNKDVLLSLYDRHPFIPLLLAYRKHSKLYTTYIKGLGNKLHSDGRLHAVGNITSTPSGRFGFKPATQNWGKAMRKIMVAPPGHVYLGADYSALELRIFALLAGERRLIEMFNDGVDVHSVHAEAFFGEVYREASPEGKKKLRTAGKPVTFGKNYGAGAKALFQQIREERMDDDPKELLREVTHMSDVFDAMYPMLMAARDYWVEEANRNHNLRTVLTRRLRKFPFGGATLTVAPNHMVQGTAGDIANLGTIKWVQAMRDAGTYWKHCWPTIQVHDFLGGEVLEAYAEEEAERLSKALYMELTYTSPISKSTNTMKFPADPKIGRSVADV